MTRFGEAKLVKKFTGKSNSLAIQKPIVPPPKRGPPCFFIRLLFDWPTLQPVRKPSYPASTFTFWLEANFLSRWHGSAG